MKRIAHAVLTAAMVLAACGKQDKATGTQYAGDPLFEVSGEMTLTTSTVTPQFPIRLAVAWYPSADLSSAPNAIVTENVQYQGSFPLNYTFSFRSVPDAAALNSYEEGGQTVRAAWGVLMAYSDVNDNGKLDTIAAGGSPVDDVLGSTIGDPYGSGSNLAPIYVVYIEGTPPAGSSWERFSAGYNLVKSGQVVPMQTPVPLPLDNTNELNFLVCEELIGGQSRSLELPCNIPPTGGVRVTANLYLQNGVPGVSARVSDGSQPIPGATVTFNGAPVAFAPAYGLYYAADAALPVHAPGMNQLQVSVPGLDPITLEVEATGDFFLIAPGKGARMASGDELAVKWSAVPQANHYVVRAYTATATYTSIVGAVTVLPTVHSGAQPTSPRSPTVSTEETRLGGFTDDALHYVDVLAMAPKSVTRGRGGSSANFAVVRGGYVDVIPASRELWAEGMVGISSWGGALYSTAWLEALDGLSSLASAQVSVNGTAMPYAPGYGRYGRSDTGGWLTAGANQDLVVKQAGKADYVASVAIPGAFQWTQLPSTAARGAQVSISWGASAGAVQYSVRVLDVNGVPLHEQLATGTSATVTAPSTGDGMFVSVSALSPNTDRHLQGYFTVTDGIALTP